jgi:hypothetical protein
MKLVVIGERNAFKAVRNHPQIFIVVVEAFAGFGCAIFDDGEISFLVKRQGFCLCIKLIKRYTQLETLDSEILLLLVDKIVVSEAQIIDGKRVCEVHVFYNYVGNIDEIGGAA